MSRKPVGKGKKATIRDVAQDAGVSTAAVSKVMRNAYGVSDKMREKVLKSIDKLDYRPSTAARGMRGRTYAVGILVVELQNPFIPTLIEEIKATLGKENYQVFISVSEAKASLESSLIDSMIDLKMDGVILIAPRLSEEILAGYASQIPMVVVANHIPGTTAFDTVNSDDALGAKRSVEALVASGKRRIEMLSLAPRRGNFDVFAAREQGYLAAMKEAGLEENIKIWHIQERENVTDLPTAQPMSAVFDKRPMAEAFFCWSDIHAVALLNKAKIRGINVPEDLAITGYDDSPPASLPLVSLTSINQNPDAMGDAAAKLLISRIEGRTEAEHRLIESTLIERGSTRAS
ncbi:LacI family DNA-binding transcriptional regulator [Celeribacter sp. ULVN23_4]